MFWANVGLYLGVNEEFLPRSYKQEVEIYSTLRSLSFKPDELVSLKFFNTSIFTLFFSCQSVRLARASIVAASHLAPLYLSEAMTSARCWDALGAGENVDLMIQLH